MFSILKWFGNTIHESIKTALIDNDDTISIRDKLYVFDDEIGVTEHIRPENDRETDIGVLGRQFRKIFSSELRSELDEIGGTAELLLESEHTSAKTTVKALGASHGTVDIVAVGSVDSIINLEADDVNVDGDLSVTGSIPDHDVIAEHTTTETDTDKVLKPDGAGGVEWDDEYTYTLEDHDIVTKHTTTENDTDKVLKPNGTGGVIFGTVSGIGETLQDDVSLAGTEPVDADVSAWANGDKGFGIGTDSSVYIMYKIADGVKATELT